MNETRVGYLDPDAIANQKGGSAKTTTAVNLAAVWARAGRRVLVCDVDGAFAATRRLGLRPGDLPATLATVLVGEASPAQALVNHELPGLRVLAGDRELYSLELSLVSEPMRERFLTSALGELATELDVALLDCPPQLGLLTINALVAADHVVAPVNMQDEGALQGLVELRATLAKLSARGEPRAIDAVLRTRVDSRRQVYGALLGGLEDLGLPVAEAQVPERALFQREAIEERPAVMAAPDSVGAVAYERFAGELAELFALDDAAALERA